MPLYTITTQSDSLSDDAKVELAAQLTALHCEVSSVPKDWVHIVFHDYPAGSGFTAGEPAATVALALLIRTGRSSECKRELLKRLWNLLRSATGAPDDQIVIGIQEVPASQAVERWGRSCPISQDNDAPGITREIRAVKYIVQLKGGVAVQGSDTAAPARMTDGAEVVSRHAEAAKQGVEKAVSNFRELVEMEAQARNNAWKVAQDRVQQNLANLQQLLQPRSEPRDRA